MNAADSSPVPRMLPGSETGGCFSPFTRVHGLSVGDLFRSSGTPRACRASAISQSECLVSYQR